MTETALVWLRSDLRIADNPALRAGMAHGKVLALHIEATDSRLRRRGAASRWWLNRSLNALAAELAALGVRLETAEGDTETVLFDFVGRHAISVVFWNRRYGPVEREIDAGIKSRCRAEGIVAESFPGTVLVEPFEMQTAAGKPYSFYTPFWKTLRARPIPAPMPAIPGTDAVAVPEVDTGYRAPAWAAKFERHWQFGERAAQARLHHFLDDLVGDYHVNRDFPDRTVGSGLAPHLAFGEISPHQIWHAAQAVAQHQPAKADAIDKFLSELAWRDFSYNQLFHREDIAAVPMQPRFADLEWRSDEAALHAWQRGRTGFPIIDAGMRELWETGFMHNRVRMLVASLLAKNLLIDWRLGEQWFWDTLLDADPANNPGNWQWVVGSGLDASPYFRIFNPVTQGDRFDADGGYVRRWVPELARLPDEWLQKPFEAPVEVLRRAGVVLGDTYPRPLVDLKLSRTRALEAQQAL